MANHHDHSYKLLFSHKKMVRDLLTGFVKEAWVEQLDFSRMEKVSGSYVTDELRDREDDSSSSSTMASSAGQRHKMSPI